MGFDNQAKRVRISNVTWLLPSEMLVVASIIHNFEQAELVEATDNKNEDEEDEVGESEIGGF